ncbi:MAG: hypothetical protein ACMUHU_02205 [Thermoplasmatota archaeon]
MGPRIRFGRPKKRGRKRSSIWSILNTFLSGILMTTGMLLLLLSLSELIVYFIDVVIKKNKTYMDWGRAPLIIFLSSIPFFILYLILNLQRFKFTAKLRNRFRSSKPPEKIETLDLD